jgi:phosphoribosyl 1,2-cyclic phosphodiesterase
MGKMPNTDPIAASRADPAPSEPFARFWGVRGSIPTPGPSTLHYGGNTACVEVRAGGQIILLDAGTGMRNLGLHLAEEFKERTLDLTLLLSHTHWDHIQGFPFFLPAYNPRTHLRILGYEGAAKGLAEALSGQMQSAYFPVAFDQLPAAIRVEELQDMEFPVGPVRVRSCFVNHPGICASYRIETSGGAMVYMTDAEPRHRVRSQPDAVNAGQSPNVDFARHEEARLTAFIQGAEVLIMDAQYDCAEYESHVGWGHACVDDVVSLAVSSGVKRLFLFHHDPAHDDGAVSRMADHARQWVEQTGGHTLVEAAREGATIPLRQESGACHAPDKPL